jgi:hypothetical protein
MRESLFSPEIREFSRISSGFSRIFFFLGDGGTVVKLGELSSGGNGGKFYGYFLKFIEGGEG